MKKHINFNQLSLPFGESRTRAISYDDRAKAFWFLATACLFSLVAYVYAVNATARNIAERGALELEAVELNAELATLEFSYIALTHGITLETARHYGFTEVAEPLYVAKDGESALSFNAQRP